MEVRETALAAGCDGEVGREGKPGMIPAAECVGVGCGVTSYSEMQQGSGICKVEEWCPTYRL